MRKILALLLWSLMVPETPGRAQPDDSGIWGEAIMAQSFDTVPFRAVKIPEWVKETTGCGYTLSVVVVPRLDVHSMVVGELE